MFIYSFIFRDIQFYSRSIASVLSVLLSFEKNLKLIWRNLNNRIFLMKVECLYLVYILFVKICLVNGDINLVGIKVPGLMEKCY